MVKQEGEGSSGGVGLGWCWTVEHRNGKSRGSEHRCREVWRSGGLFIVHDGFLFSVMAITLSALFTFYPLVSNNELKIKILKSMFRFLCPRDLESFKTTA